METLEKTDAQGKKHVLSYVDMVPKSSFLIDYIDEPEDECFETEEPKERVIRWACSCGADGWIPTETSVDVFFENHVRKAGAIVV